MANQGSPPLVSPLTSPEIRISRPDYSAIPQRPRNDSSESRKEKRSRFEEAIDPGLGIQMIPMASLTSPGNIYQQNSPPKPGMYSPLTPSGSRPSLSRTPDSQYSLASNFSRSRTDPMTERLIAHRSTQAAQWKVHWRTPTLMVATFCAGILLALGQHWLYKSLHHKSEPNEGKKFRYVLYGRALAYLSKVAFGGCVVLVYRQRIWRTFREQALSVWSIDQLFQASEDPSLFLNWETISKAPILVTVAIIIWLIPLATIVFSPGALTFGDFLEIDNVNLAVPNLNFTMESYKDWRRPVVTKGVKKKSVMFYNTTDSADPPTKEGWFDWYDQPSSDATRLSLMMAYNLMDHPLTRQDARLDSCGGNYNCTYTTDFIGPGYKCEEVAHGIGDSGQLSEFGAPFNTSMLIPEGRHVYYADVDIGKYKRPQADNLSNRGGEPLGPMPDDLGFFKSEPVLWIGYSVNTTKRVPADSPYAQNWTHEYDPFIFRCTHYETKYTVKWNYTEPFFMTHTSYEYLKPVVDTNFSRLEDGSIDYENPGPAENFISPRTDVPLYKKTAAYVALGESLRQFLRGKVDFVPPLPGPSYAVVFSDITRTRLVDNVTSTPRAHLPNLVQDFYKDMVLSLFSAEQMLVVSEDQVSVSRTRYQSAFIYLPHMLWKCYAPVILVTLIVLLFGAVTIWEDGTSFSVGFSRILVTTRNITLDEISRGACLGNDPFPMELMHTKLKFGVLNEGSDVEYLGMESSQGVGHCTFGVPSEVAPIRKGMPYSGLNRSSRSTKAKKEKVD